MSQQLIIKDAFAKRSNERPGGYSLRAFASDIGVSPGFVSQVFKGTKSFSLRKLLRVCEVLDLRAGERDLLFSDSTLRVTPRKRPHFEITTDQFNTFSRWYHPAILDLTTCKNFRNDSKWIAGRLGISSVLVEEAIARLKRLGLLEEKNGSLVKTKKEITVQTNKPVDAVRTFHEKMLSKASDELRKKNQFERRSISGMTLAIRPERLSQAKILIEKFQNDLADLLTEGDCTEVYHIGVQLFPLTLEPFSDRTLK